MNPRPSEQSAASLASERRRDGRSATIVSLFLTAAAAALLVALMYVHGQMPTTTDGPGGLAIVLFEWPVALMAGMALLGAVITALIGLRVNLLVGGATLVVHAGIAFLMYGYLTSSPTWKEAAAHFSAQHLWEEKRRGRP